MKIYAKIGLLAGLSLMGLGVFKMIATQIKLLSSYCYKIKDVIIRNFNANDVNLTILILLKNQSDIDIVIENYDFDVLINGMKVANLKRSKYNGIWKARSTSELSLDISFNPTEIFSQLNKVASLVLNIFSHPENVIFQVAGEVTIKHSFIKLTNLPVDIQMSLSEINETGSNDEYECNIDEDGKK